MYCEEHKLVLNTPAHRMMAGGGKAKIRRREVKMEKWKAYPHIGTYLRVRESHELEYIQACPMMRDGSRATDEEICDVDDWRQLYIDLLNPPEDSEQSDWKQALIKEIKKESWLENEEG